MYHLLRNTTIVYGGFEEDSRFHVEHILDVVWSGRGRVLVLFPVNRPGHLHLLSRGARGGRGGRGSLFGRDVRFQELLGEGVDLI